MNTTQSLDFGSQSVTESYDQILVPLIFDPWAEMLLDHLPPEPTWSVLDLATGTGIVAYKLAQRIGDTGSVTGVDLSADMLRLAKRRCASSSGSVRFIECPANSLSLGDRALDAIYCQQGVQFFPERLEAAREMHRVLGKGGQVALSAWCSVDECEFFGLVCRVLRECGEDEIAHMMSIPFNFMPEDEWIDCISTAGFQQISVERQQMNLAFKGGIDAAIRSVYATPIGPSLLALNVEKRRQVERCLVSALMALTNEGITASKMSSLVLTANKMK